MLLTRLEAKVVDASGRSAGLNLTRATLDAATKYPWPRSRPPQVRGVRRRPTGLRLGPRRRAGPTPLPRGAGHGLGRRRRLLASTTSRTRLHAGHLEPATLHDDVEHAELLALTRQSYAPGAGTPDPTDLAELEAALDRLLALPAWPTSFDGCFGAQVALKQPHQRADRTVLSRGAGGDPGRVSATARLRRYEADLVVPDETRLECAVLKAITALYVMRRKGAPEHYARQRDLVAELAAAVLAGAPATLEEPYRSWYALAGDDAAALRVVIDQVAGLTDPAAQAWHRRLCRVAT